MEIPKGAPSSIATPSAGNVSLFIDTTNSDTLSYKQSDGTVVPYGSGNLDASLREMCDKAVLSVIDGANVALAKGLLKSTDYTAMTKFQVDATATVASGVTTIHIVTTHPA